MRPPARLRGRLNALADTPVNYDPATLDLDDPPPGWSIDERRQPLPSEAPGPAEPRGSFAMATKLIHGYEFADPSLVRAFYDPDAPLLGRDMLLELRALGLVSIHVGTRVAVVWDEERQVDGRAVRVWGWAYRTLEGHVECGQMDWQVWKWLDSGEVEFRIHAVSRTASISNPFIWLGFHAAKHYERNLYLDTTDRRMRELTTRAVREGSAVQAVREASSKLTVRGREDDPAHEALAREIEAEETATG